MERLAGEKKFPSKPSLVVSYDRAFLTRQGEGPTAGETAVFLRLQVCNLTCGFCDAGGTWNQLHPQFADHERWSIDETAREIARCDEAGCKHLVITGGEPALQQKGIAGLLAQPLLQGWAVEIETNGTKKLVALESFRDRLLLNISPKLGNSGEPKERRIVPGALEHLVQHFRHCFKFVVATEADVHEAATEFSSFLRREQCLGIFASPMGIASHQIQEIRNALCSVVEGYGWTLGDRLQIHQNIP